MLRPFLIARQVIWQFNPRTVIFNRFLAAKLRERNGLVDFAPKNKKFFGFCVFRECLALNGEQAKGENRSLLQAFGDVKSHLRNLHRSLAQAT